jgi:hypothetical protein
MDGPSCDSSDDDHPTALDAEVGVVHPINLSDPGAEEALYDIQSMRTFCGLEGATPFLTRRRSSISAICSSATL